MKIGILGTSEIAFRRFLPALEKSDYLEFAGIASRDISKTDKFTDVYGGRGYDSYNAILDDSDIDCMYIPLPPSMHFEWAKKALERGKHVLLEKPFTTSLANTTALVEYAKSMKLALHENYTFLYHSQIEWICSKLQELGKLRLIRADFGFPFRGSTDFRYDKELGGGALLDCGGYTLKLALALIGDTTTVTDARTGYECGYDVDMYGSATLINNDGLTAQVSFGMDNSYRCLLDVWGSEGSMTTERVFTAPDDYTPIMVIRNKDGRTEYTLEPDNSFKNSIAFFLDCVKNGITRIANYSAILKQAELIDQFKKQDKLGE